MIADPLWSCVMLLCGSFVGPLRYLVIPHFVACLQRYLKRTRGLFILFTTKNRDSIGKMSGDLRCTCTIIHAHPAVPVQKAIHPRVIFEIRHEIAQPLAMLFNRSLESNQIPTIWKCANIARIYKRVERMR